MDKEKIPIKTEFEKEKNENMPIRMPSAGQRFKLMNTRFEVIKSQGLRFTAKAIDNA